MDFGAFFAADYLMSFVTTANILGLIGGMLYISSVSMKTVIPLRIASIGSAFFFLLSAIFARSVPAMFLYSLLVPLNSIRLYQMMDLIKKVRAAATGDLSMDWLQPFMKTRRYRKGDVLFRKGDIATEMFLLVKGRYRVSEFNIELKPGQIFGELGLLTSENHRTATVECIESGIVRTITYDEVRGLYFENPEFGFHFLRLTSDRLLQNLANAEKALAAERQKHAVAGDSPLAPGTPAPVPAEPSIAAARNRD